MRAHIQTRNTIPFNEKLSGKMKYRKTVSESPVHRASCHGVCKSSTVSGILHCCNNLNAACIAHNVPPLKVVELIWKILINEAPQQGDPALLSVYY